MNWKDPVPALHCEMQVLSLHDIVAHAECYQHTVDSLFYKQLVLTFAVLEAERSQIKVEGAEHRVRADAQPSFLVHK